MLRASLPTSNVNSANLMAATLTDPNFQANFLSNTSLAPIVDQQNLTHVFTDELALKNSLDVETDVLLDAVVHMMQNRVFIPLSLLTTTALHRIQLNQMSSSGESPLEMALAVPRSMKLLSLLKIHFLSQILASYKNWLAPVKLLCSPATVHGWHSHHGKMVSDHHFSLWFPAWHAHDKLL